MPLCISKLVRKVKIEVDKGNERQVFSCASHNSTRQVKASSTRF